MPVTRVALVEDDPVCRGQLKEYLDQYSRETGHEFSIRVFEDGEDIVSGYRPEFDVILMDIQMKYLDGMTAAEEIRRIDAGVVILFITSLASYAIRGYAVDALDYILKPVTYFAFSQSLRRALDRLERRRRRYVVVSHRNGARRVDCSRIYYIEIDGRNLIYHTEDGDLAAAGSMRDVEESLEGGPFFRCNKGYLVNLEHVDGLDGEDALVHGVRVQVSRSKKKAFLDALNRCFNEVGQ